MILALLACASPPVAQAPLAARATPLEITPLVADADGALIPAVAGVTPLRYVPHPASLPYTTLGIEARGLSAPCGVGPYGAIQLEVDVLTRAPDGNWLPITDLYNGSFVDVADEHGRFSLRSGMSPLDFCALNGATATVTWLAMDPCTGATASAVIELPLWIEPSLCPTEAP
jgi:hypothetical protein